MTAGWRQTDLFIGNLKKEGRFICWSVLLTIIVMASCTASAADSLKPPNGEEVFAALLQNLDVSLAAEPLCKANTKLSNHLALALSVSYANKNTATLKSSCVPSKFDIATGKTMDIWDCTIQINENSQKGEFISSSTIAFGLTPDTKKFVKGSLRCR